MRLWKNRTMTMMGTVTTMAAAAMAPVGTWKVDAPGNCDSAAGTVCAFLVDVSEKAKTKSFQAKMKTRIAVVNTPGAASGAITLVKAWNGVAPSTCAACSSSHGISLKKAESVKIESGRAKVMYGMIRPGQVSYRPRLRHML